MYRLPSRKAHLNKQAKPNLNSILDAIFIFIFFLLMTSAFIHVNEIASDAPIISTTPPPDQKPPLALTLRISKGNIQILRGVPSSPIKNFSVTNLEDFNYPELHNYLVEIKKRYPQERSIIFEPTPDISFDHLVLIMDSVRMMNKTDPEIFIKNKDNIDIKVNELFDKIVFGNVQS